METKKLTCCDLMVGDLVRQKHSGRVFRVSIIHPPYIREDNEIGQYKEDTIEPIPLTAEVLERNGFSELMEHDEWTCIFRKYIDELIIEVGIYEPMFINIGHLDGDGKEENLSSIVKVKGENFFFHDLQHVMRLCGINDKEIVL